MMRTAASIDPELRSAIFSLAIASRSARLTLPTFSLLGTPEPFSILAFSLIRTLAGELYLSEKMKEKMLHRLVKTGTTEVVYAIDSLSDREMEVFQLIGNGYGTRQIAEQLHLSVKTIDSYREHLKLKLRLESGTELVRHAIQWVKSEGIV